MRRASAFFFFFFYYDRVKKNSYDDQPLTRKLDIEKNQKRPDYYITRLG